MARKEEVPIDGGKKLGLSQRGKRLNVGKGGYKKTAYAVFAFLATVHVLLFLYVALSRIRFPFDLEWLEGSMLVNVQRVLAGASLYVRPSVDFTCYQYPPLFCWTAALACRPYGVGYFQVRLVSLLATMGTFMLLFLFVRRETKSSLLGIMASGTYAAAFKCTGAWFDLIRVDSLFVFWLMAAVYCVRSPKVSVGSSVLAAVFFLLSFFTKQPALFVFAGCAVYLMMLDWRQGVIMTSLFILGAVAGIAILNVRTHGWYFFYTFTLLREHPVETSAFYDFWRFDLMLHVPIVLLGLCYFVCCELAGNGRRRFFFPLLASSTLLGCWLSRMHSGSVINVNMPAFAVMAAIFPLAIHDVAGQIPDVPSRRVRALTLAASAAVGLQFILLLYAPGPCIPTKADEAAGWNCIEKLRSIEGDIFIPCNSYYASIAGKRTFSHAMTIYDITRAKNEETLQRDLIAELVQAFAERRFAAVIVPSEGFGNKMVSAAQNFYREVPSHLFEGAAFPLQEVFGTACKPNRLFVPR